jgi:hypothetical protein
MSEFYKGLLDVDNKEFMFEICLIRNGMIIHDTYDGDGTCSICLDDFKDKCVFKLKCSHMYHRECILESIIHCGGTVCCLCRGQ